MELLKWTEWSKNKKEVLQLLLLLQQPNEGNIELTLSIHQVTWTSQLKLKDHLEFLMEQLLFLMDKLVLNLKQKQFEDKLQHMEYLELFS